MCIWKWQVFTTNFAYKGYDAHISTHKLHTNEAYKPILSLNLPQVWQCGGQVLIATCSRVGHVFRKVSPYSWPGGVVKILNHNTLRTVNVWMDEYKDFFLKINPGIRTEHRAQS